MFAPPGMDEEWDSDESGSYSDESGSYYSSSEDDDDDETEVTTPEPTAAAPIGGMMSQQQQFLKIQQLQQAHHQKEQQFQGRLSAATASVKSPQTKPKPVVVVVQTAAYTSLPNAPVYQTPPGKTMPTLQDNVIPATEDPSLFETSSSASSSSYQDAFMDHHQETVVWTPPGASAPAPASADWARNGGVCVGVASGDSIPVAESIDDTSSEEGSSVGEPAVWTPPRAVQQSAYARPPVQQDEDSSVSENESYKQEPDIWTPAPAPAIKSFTKGVVVEAEESSVSSNAEGHYEEGPPIWTPSPPSPKVNMRQVMVQEQAQENSSESEAAVYAEEPPIWTPGMASTPASPRIKSPKKLQVVAVQEDDSSASEMAVYDVLPPIWTPGMVGPVHDNNNDDDESVNKGYGVEVYTGQPPRGWRPGMVVKSVLFSEPTIEHVYVEDDESGTDYSIEYVEPPQFWTPGTFTDISPASSTKSGSSKVQQTLYSHSDLDTSSSIIDYAVSPHTWKPGMDIQYEEPPPIWTPYMTQTSAAVEQRVSTFSDMAVDNDEKSIDYEYECEYEYTEAPVFWTPGMAAELSNQTQAECPPSTEMSNGKDLVWSLRLSDTSHAFVAMSEKTQDEGSNVSQGMLESIDTLSEIDSEHDSDQKDEVASSLLIGNISQVSKDLLGILMCRNDDVAAILRATYSVPPNPAKSAANYVANNRNDSSFEALLMDHMSAASKELLAALMNQNDYKAAFFRATCTAPSQPA